MPTDIPTEVAAQADAPEQGARARLPYTFAKRAGVILAVDDDDGAVPDPVEGREAVARELARFKAPRAVAVCNRIARHANGKADYAWAAAVAESAVPAVAPRTPAG